MTRPPLEVADVIRSAGPSFVEPTVVKVDSFEAAGLTVYDALQGRLSSSAIATGSTGNMRKC